MFSNKAIRVYVRLMFLRIGEIDTLNEKYQAQASIESRWPVEFDKFSPNLSSDEQTRLIHGKSISLINYAESNWHPQLYIENILGDLKEQLRYSAKISKADNQIYICEHRDIKGIFWEKLELQHFPSDVQELSISIGSMLYDDKVLLIADPYHLSGINREVFIDQQEWSLYEHVDTKQRHIKEFLFRGGDEEEDNDEDDDASISTNKERKRSILTVTCHAAMDKYAIMCLFILVILSIWHAIIGGLIYRYTSDFHVTSITLLINFDRYVLYTAIGIYIIIHGILLIWLFCVPLKHRRELNQKDIQYRQLLSKNSQLSKTKSKNNSDYIPISV
ncbi:unnamed protein product [Rotaria sp. Silwood1]|nr:unnamed protein product [Rotaria sp. Silwood1]